MVEWVPFPYYLSRISFSRLSLTVALRHLVIALEKGECLKSCEKDAFRLCIKFDFPSTFYSKNDVFPVAQT